ncbi:MAG: carbonic anhydrase [Lentimonas sp.]|jgi:carbonic anhydrase
MKNISYIITVLFSIILTSVSNAQVTKSEQEALTPDQVVEKLMAGNKRYVGNNLSSVDIKGRITASASGQSPKAVILSCLDSRVSVEKIFDLSIGDIFVGRVAGNIENEDQIGSMEFATKIAGSKLVMVLGHESCGAVKGACQGVKLGNLTELLEKIQPAISAVEGFSVEERTVENAKFVAAVVEQNVKKTVADIRRRSVVLSDLEKSGDIKIVGAVYSLKTGEVQLLD